MSMKSIVNSMVGSGLVAIPYAFKSLGLVMSVVSLIFVTLMSSFTFYVVCILADHASSFVKLARITKNWLGIIVDAAVLSQSFGVCISYLILIGDSVPPLLGIIGLNVTRRIVIVTAMFVLLPMSLLRNLKSLAFASGIAIVSIVYILSVIVFFFIVYLNSDMPSTEIDLVVFNLESLKGLPIIVFGLACHQNIFKIYSEMKDKTLEKISVSGLIAFVFSASVYFIVGVCSYLVLGRKVSGDLFSSFEKHFPALLKIDPHLISLFLARLFLALLVLTAYPMQSHPARDCIRNIRKRFSSIEPEEEPLLDTRLPQAPKENFSSTDLSCASIEKSTDSLCVPDSTLVHTVSTLIFCLGTMFVALIVEDFGKMISIVGALAATPVVFIFGPLFYLLLESDGWKRKVSLVIIPSACLFAIVVLWSELFFFQ